MKHDPAGVRTRTHLLTAALTTGLLTGLLTALPAGTATAAPAGFADDFNGDGVRDLVTAAPGATVGGKAYAGAVVVNYGSASGISAARRTVLTQNTAGVPGGAEAHDEFGSALASGDLDRDGYADLVIGTEKEDVGGDKDGGGVTVVWGGKDGLSGGSSVPDPTPSAHDAFGLTLAVGDFDGDRRPDLAVGSTGKDVWIHEGLGRNTPATARHKVTADLTTGIVGGARVLASGDLDKDGTADLVVGGSYATDEPSAYFDGTQVFLGGEAGPVRQAVLRSGAYETAAVGDVDGDGHDDVVTGASPGSVRADDGGSVSVWLGGPDGVRTQAAQTLTQDSPGVPGADEPDDWFGHALSLDDIDGDGRADLAVSANFETIGAAELAGSVTVLRGGPAGLTTTGAQSFTQNTAGVPGTAETGDRFGWSLRLTDVNRDGRADLAVGADAENAGDGGVWLLPGTSTGVTTRNTVNFGPSSVGLSTAGAPRLGAGMLR
ncbi:FG-GAP and VCBS repeat-containing protein [Streptomyces sp. NPDC091377]|uniref:FG-GAP and VCBS repeat-containing protein n=1 Tax=Streptomyces sp. NPDC091377 TaxID=3365995 RepID=UPI00380CFFBC